MVSYHIYSILDYIINKRKVVECSMKTKLLNALYYGVLQALTILTATVLVGGLAGVSIPTVLFGTGLATIVFTLVTKGRVPIAQGSSGAWLGTAIAMSAYGLDHIVGVTVLGAIFYVAFGLLIKKFPKILSVFTPYILNLAVLMIALSLVQTAVGLITTHPITAVVTIVGILLASFTKVEKFAFPIGIVAGTIVHGVLYGLSSTMGDIFVPTLVIPAINSTTLLASLAFIGICCEALGDSKYVCEVIGTEYKPDEVIIGNGLASLCSGLFGMMPTTTYSESCGLVKATGYASGLSIIICGIIYLLAAFIPQVSYVINLIPSAALSGMLLYLFSMVTTQKIHEIKLEDKHSVSVGIIGISAFFAAPALFPSVSSIAVGMIAMIITHLGLKLIKK